MKKAIVTLVFVLSIASMASAIPLISVDKATIGIGEVATITITGTAAEAGSITDGGGGNYAVWADYTNGNHVYDMYPGINGVVIMSNVQILAGAGGAADAEAVYPIATYDGFDIAAASVFNATSGEYEQLVQAADWFTVDITGIGVGTIAMELTNSASSVRLASVDVTVVPEPTTLLLLGLGAVMFRKKC